MTRLYLLIGGLSALAIALVAVWFLGGQSARDKAERQGMESTINSVEEFNEGSRNPDNLGWFDRLFPGSTD